MTPLFTAALQTLAGPTIARGSTLMNITQQIASSVGAAVMSVVLKNEAKSSSAAGPAIVYQHGRVCNATENGPTTRVRARLDRRWPLLRGHLNGRAYLGVPDVRAGTYH